MLKAISFVLVALTASCAQNNHVKVVSPCEGRSGAEFEHCMQMRSEIPSTARSAGRAAGAGGSHAPGSTGTGSGTHAADSSAEIGAAR